MNKTMMAIAVGCLLVTGRLGENTATAYDATDFSAAGRKLQPAPGGHAPGKDNGAGTGTHNPGEDCGICHRPNGKAPNHVFTMAGTLYADRTARSKVAGGEIILEDINGKVISMTSNEAGNFWTFEAIGSNPRAVASHSGVTHKLYNDADPNNIIDADPTDSRTWQYKAWVKNGDHVSPMITIAPVGGSTDPLSRMSCNMHHAALGSRGGLWGSEKNTLPSYPATGLSFKKHIQPIFKSKCAPCHIPGETLTRLVTESDILTPSTSFDYSKGLDLTSYAASSVTVSGVPIVKKGVIDLAAPHQADPTASPLLTMPASAATHPGGKFWTVGTADYQAIRQWIAEGALNN